MPNATDILPASAVHPRDDNYQLAHDLLEKPYDAYADGDLASASVLTLTVEVRAALGAPASAASPPPPSGALAETAHHALTGQGR